MLVRNWTLALFGFKQTPLPQWMCLGVCVCVCKCESSDVS